MFHPCRQLAFADKRFDFGKIPAVIVMMLVGVNVFMPMFIVMRVLVRMSMSVRVVVVFVMAVMMVHMAMLVMMGVLMFVVMFMLMRVRVFMIMFMRQMHIKFHPFNSHFLFPRDMQVVASEIQFLEFMFKLVRVHAQVNQRPNEHVAADAAENVEIESFHDLELLAKALIWLAAYPAPKPLSIFTTVTPLPQLFNMPSNAASPPKLAP